MGDLGRNARVSTRSAVSQCTDLKSGLSGNLDACPLELLDP